MHIKKLKVSIITPVYNGGETIEDTILSVAGQNYPFMEHIVIDGGSGDNTIEVLNKHRDKIAVCISEPDNGIYDAINKGIKLSRGEIVGILNSDDIFYDRDCVYRIVKEIKSKRVDAVYGNLVYVTSKNLNKIVRYYDAKSFDLKKFAIGMMPPHPTFYTYRKCYEKFGYYKTNYKIAADYELLLRFLNNYQVSSAFIDKILVKMRIGGASTKNFKSNWILNKEILKACNENNVETSFIKVWSKYVFKIFQLFQRPDFETEKSG